jgi:hypothetical protein
MRQRPIVESKGRVRRETPRTTTGTVALPNHPRATFNENRSNSVKPTLLVKMPVKYMQLIYNEHLTTQIQVGPVRPGSTWFDQKK